MSRNPCCSLGIGREDGCLGRLRDGHGAIWRLRGEMEEGKSNGSLGARGAVAGAKVVG
jgi:hypothetical protein